MTTRQLLIAVAFVLILSVMNIHLYGYAFLVEWFQRQRFSELVSLALHIAFFAVFLAFLEIAFYSGAGQAVETWPPVSLIRVFWW
jgi:hypothetical protein